MKISNPLMMFESWLALNESFDASAVKSSVKKTLEPAMGKLAAVYPFGDAPGLDCIFFSDGKKKNIKSFAIYFKKGTNNFNSIDFWPSDSKNPSATIKSDQVSLDEILPFIPEILKDPKPNKTITIGTNEAQATGKVVKLHPAEDKEDDRAIHVEHEIGKEGYKYGKPDVIFRELEKYVDMVIKGIRSSLLVSGMAGIGKTFLTTKQIEEAGLKLDKDYVAITGKSTAIGLYMALYKYNGMLLVFDDCDAVFDGPSAEDATNVLKGALEGGKSHEIAWLSGRALKDDSMNVIPRKFLFTGKMIFLTNLPKRKLPKPLRSRGFVHEMALSPNDMIKYLEKKLPDIQAQYPMSMSFKRIGLDMLKNIAKNNVDVTIDFRTLLKTYDILATTDEPDLAEDMIIQQCAND